MQGQQLRWRHSLGYINTPTGLEVAFQAGIEHDKPEDYRVDDPDHVIGAFNQGAVFLHLLKDLPSLHDIFTATWPTEPGPCSMSC